MHKEKNIVPDSVIRLSGYTSEKKYPDVLRRIALQEPLADRAVLQMDGAKPKHPKVWGTTENAVRIQIYCAITAYCLVAIVYHDLKLNCSVHETLQIIGMSLTDTITPKDLLNKSNFNNVKEQIDIKSDGFSYTWSVFICQFFRIFLFLFFLLHQGCYLPMCCVLF